MVGIGTGTGNGRTWTAMVGIGNGSGTWTAMVGIRNGIVGDLGTTMVGNNQPKYERWGSWQGLGASAVGKYCEPK